MPISWIHCTYKYIFSLDAGEKSAPKFQFTSFQFIGEILVRPVCEFMAHWAVACTVDRTHYQNQMYDYFFLHQTMYIYTYFFSAGQHLLNSLPSYALSANHFYRNDLRCKYLFFVKRSMFIAQRALNQCNRNFHHDIAFIHRIQFANDGAANRSPSPSSFQI